jgi:hypothetical protein
VARPAAWRDCACFSLDFDRAQSGLPPFAIHLHGEKTIFANAEMKMAWVKEFFAVERFFFALIN